MKEIQKLTQELAHLVRPQAKVIIFDQARRLIKKLVKAVDAQMGKKKVCKYPGCVNYTSTARVYCSDPCRWHRVKKGGIR